MVGVEKFRTKNEIVYNFLKANIFKGNLKPGEKLNVRKISKQLGVSEIPTREALRSLKSEGLVEYTPHLGARVVRIDKKDLEELHTIRCELECLATRLAASNMKQEDFNKLGKIIGEFEKILRSGKYEKSISELNKEFHMAIYKKSNNAQLFKLIVDLWARSQLIPSVFSRSGDRRKQSHQEHKSILEALRAGKGDLAASITREQKQRAWKTIANVLNNAE